MAGKNPEDVVRRYIQKVKTPPDEVSRVGLARREGKGWVGRVTAVPPTPSQDCTICMERLVTSSGYEGVLSHRGIKPELVGKLGKCGHMYHLLCLVAMYNNGNKVRPAWGHRGGRVTCSGWVAQGWAPMGPHAHPVCPRRTAACSAPPARPSTGRRRARSPPGRWSFTSSPIPSRVTPTPKPSGSSTTSPPASR